MSELTIGDWAGAVFLSAKDVDELKDKYCCITEVKGFKHSDKYNKENFVVEVELPNQQKRTWSMNKTSARNIIHELGTDTSKWKGATLELCVKEMIVRGESKRVIIATPAFKKPKEIKIS
jgi:hypothetical protein